MFKFLLFSLFMMVLIGCDSSSSSEEYSTEYNDVKKLINSMQYSYRGRPSNVPNDARVFNQEIRNFTINSDFDYYQTPMIVDIRGNISKGGLLKVINKEQNDVEIEAIDKGVFSIEIDTNKNQKMDEKEKIIYRLEPLEPVYGEITTTLMEMLEASDGDEEMEVTILLRTPKALFLPDGNSSKESLIRSELNRQFMEEFITLNELSKSPSMTSSIEDGRDSFHIFLKKDRVFNILESNREKIWMIEDTPVAVDE